MQDLIETEDDLSRGLDWLGGAEPRFARTLAQFGRPPLRRRPGGFAGLLRIVCAQQVSVGVADTMWRRLQEVGANAPDRIAVLSEDDLRGCGLSRAKVRYARALAAAAIDYDALPALDDEAVVARLTALPGIGRWTAEVYLMVCLGRADAFAPGDLALREGARLLFGLDSRPSANVLAAMAKDWSPWRAVAARMIWHHYAGCRRRDGVI